MIPKGQEAPSVQNATNTHHLNRKRNHPPKKINETKTTANPAHLRNQRRDGERARLQTTEGERRHTTTEKNPPEKPAGIAEKVPAMIEEHSEVNLQTTERNDKRNLTVGEKKMKSMIKNQKTTMRDMRKKLQSERNETTMKKRNDPKIEVCQGPDAMPPPNTERGRPIKKRITLKKRAKSPQRTTEIQENILRPNLNQSHPQKRQRKKNPKVKIVITKSAVHRQLKEINEGEAHRQSTDEMIHPRRKANRINTNLIRNP